MILPSGDTVKVEAGANTFAATDRPGFYIAKSADGEEEDRVFAVNLAPGESRIDPIDPVASLGELGVNVESDAAARLKLWPVSTPLKPRSRRSVSKPRRKKNGRKSGGGWCSACCSCCCSKTWLLRTKENAGSSRKRGVAEFAKNSVEPGTREQNMLPGLILWPSEFFANSATGYPPFRCRP